MSAERIEIAETASAGDIAELRDKILEFNYVTTGFRDGRSLSCFLRDGSGNLYAGVDGFTWGGYARIEYLWVDEARRGRGLGRALLMAAEAEAARRGCATIVLDTHSFQAPEFYRRLRYTQVGETLDTPLGFSQVLFQKRI
jgi:ribosomal protein S18 acetylase RimI-like enzyme